MSRKIRPTSRYYAQYLHEAGAAWWVMDRDIPDPPHTELRLCSCRNRRVADKIRDALNAAEDRLREAQR